MITAKDVDLLYEVGALRHVPRTWHQFGGLPLANVSEHTLRVAWIGLILAAQEGADSGKVVRMAILHDLPESRTGDVNYLSRMYVARDEGRALADISSATVLEGDLRDLWKELEQQESIESQIVKDADNLDVDLELRERAFDGTDFSEMLRPARERLALKLHTAAAKALYEIVCSRNPHAWHFEGVNRINSGDWKE